MIIIFTPNMSEEYNTEERFDLEFDSLTEKQKERVKTLQNKITNAVIEGNFDPYDKIYKFDDMEEMLFLEYRKDNEGKIIFTHIV